MKFILVVAFLVAVASAADALQARRMTRPVARHTWEEWQQIMAAQPKSRYVAPRRNGGRIIAGSNASSGQFPYQVAVLMDSSYFCGGSLISQTTVLTAGHCVDGISSFQLHLGTLSPNGGGSGSVTTSSRNSVLHSQYNPNTINNDIGLVRLSSAVSLNSVISLVSLASNAGNNYEGAIATVSGWGLTSDSSQSISSVLKYVDLVVISNSQCAQTYGNVITASKLCTTGNPRGSTCSGDSGGPLVNGGQQIGIVSFGASAGCELGYPAAFTRVTSFLSWISSNSDAKF